MRWKINIILNKQFSAYFVLLDVCVYLKNFFNQTIVQTNINIICIKLYLENTLCKYILLWIINITKGVKYLVSIMFFSQSLLDALFVKLIYTVKNHLKYV